MENIGCLYRKRAVNIYFKVFKFREQMLCFDAPQEI